MNQKYTTLEQAEYLNSIIGGDTADMMYSWERCEETGWEGYVESLDPFSETHHFKEDRYPDIPCWSCTALIEEVLPGEILVGSTRYILDVRPLHTSLVEKDRKVCTVGYRSFDITTGDTQRNLNVRIGSVLFDVVFELVLSLIAQGIIERKKV